MAVCRLSSKHPQTHHLSLLQHFLPLVDPMIIMELQW
jgi:hypothetical protein